ncbi:MAG: hypothetical protein KC656_18020 [Myxococcales bacterium]|nr:hypothetical protein [Myxococcales bacterium]MCB9692898.1 hypothetical protein [Alphaproteobacteria bacterium]
MLLSLFAALAAPAPEEGPTYTVTVDPLTWAIGYAHVQVERRVGHHASIYVGPHARLYDGILTDGHEPFIGIGGEVGVRAFPWGRAPEGAWIMGRQVLARLSTTDGSADPKVGGYSSVLVGYTGVLGKGFVLSGGAGLNMLYYSIGDYGPSGPFPALHTNLGWAF